MEREHADTAASRIDAATPLDIHATFTRDREYIQRLIRDAARPQMWSGALHIVALLLAAVLCFASRSGLAVLAGLMLLVLCGIVCNGFVSSRRRLGELASHILEPCQMAITDDAVTAESETASSRHSWSAIVRAQERPYAFLLFLPNRTYRDVPRSSLTAEQDEQLRSALIERRLLRPPAGLPRPTEHADQRG